MDVEFSQNGASGIITLNRPDALNALTLSMVRDMAPVLKIGRAIRRSNMSSLKGRVKRAFAPVVIFARCMIGGVPVTPRQPAFIAKNTRSTISSKHFPNPILP